jgi:hypothetical protein
VSQPAVPCMSDRNISKITIAIFMSCVNVVHCLSVHDLRKARITQVRVCLNLSVTACYGWFGNYGAVRCAAQDGMLSI